MLSRRELALVAAGFTLLTLALTYPQIRLLSSHTAPHYDALFTVWRLAWIAHQLPRDPVHLFDANIFFPAPRTLAYSDAILLPGLVGAPLIWIGVHPVTVHNVLVLLSFVACGVTMYVLVRGLTASALAAWCGGIIFAFQAYRIARLAQLELLWGFWIPLAFWALHRALATRRLRDGVLIGVFVALQAWSSLYYAVFLITALAVLSLVLIPSRPRAELSALLKPAVAAMVVCVVLVTPYAMPYLESRQIVGARTEQEIRRWSPTPRNYFATPPENWIYGRALGRLGHLEGIMFPGMVATALAVAGAAARGRRRLAYAVLLVVAVDMSLGFNGLTYRAFFEVLWPYQGLRVSARMFVVVSAALAVLAADGLARLAWRKRRTSRLLGVALTGAVLLESASVPVPLKAAPAVSPIYSWLRQQPRAVVMEWPMPRAGSLGFTHEPYYMYFSIFHWHPLVNGYSGFYPPRYLRFVEGVRHFPNEEAIGYIRRAGVRYLILHREFAPERYAALRAELEDHPDLKPLLTEGEGEDEVTVYELRARQPPTGR